MIVAVARRALQHSHSHNNQETVRLYSVFTITSGHAEIFYADIVLRYYENPRVRSGVVLYFNNSPSNTFRSTIYGLYELFSSRAQWLLRLFYAQRTDAPLCCGLSLCSWAMDPRREGVDGALHE